MGCSHSVTGEKSSGIDEKSAVELLRLPRKSRKYSVSSVTDQDLARRDSFSSKTTEQYGDPVDWSGLGLGYACRKGRKVGDGNPNQDSWLVLRAEKQFSMYAVFDGHGKMGHDVSNYVKDNLPKVIIRDKRFTSGPKSTMLKEAFQEMQAMITAASSKQSLSAEKSGTTATIAIHDHTSDKISIAHVGDSGVCIGARSPGQALSATALTRDHKPDVKEEKARIRENGGSVQYDGRNHRVYVRNEQYPGLNMSRCLGDLLGHDRAGLSCEPDVLEYSLRPEDEVLILCTDGVWECLSPEDAISVIGDSVTGGACMDAAEALALKAWNRWIEEEGGSVVDDITVVVVDLREKDTSRARRVSGTSRA